MVWKSCDCALSRLFGRANVGRRERSRSRSDSAFDFLRHAREHRAAGWSYAAIRGRRFQHRDADAGKHSGTLDPTNLCRGLYSSIRTDSGPAAPRSMVQKKNVVLIEDLAQALGARLPDGAAAGSAGDLSVFSFNPTKILECGGGALLIRSQKLAPVCAELAASDPLPPEIDEGQARTLALSYRNLHHSLVGLLRARAIEDISSAFLKLQPAFRALYLHRMNSPAALVTAWAQLQQVLQHRYRNAQKYDEVLAEGNLQRLTQWQQSGVCWRYSLLVNFPEKLVEFSEAVRRDGFHVSNLYWPVNDFFRPGDLCPNADQFARRIINLWVDQTVDRQWVNQCGQSLLRNARALAS
jgi:hypothetical protein